MAVYRLLIIFAIFACCPVPASAQGEQENSCLRQVASCVDSCGKLQQTEIEACTERCQRDIPCMSQNEPQTDLPTTKLPGSDLPSNSLPDSKLPPH